MMMNPRYAVIAATSLAAGLLTIRATSTAPAGNQEPVQPATFNVQVMTTSLDTPWDLAWGPDGMIWVSERNGRVSRVDPDNGRRTTAGTVDDVHESGEGGLMGIAFHPDFASTPYVYAMHTYGGRIGTRNKLVRMRWSSGALGKAETLLDGIPGAGNHNGSRIAVGPDRLLYITTGDAGNADLSQDSTSLGGKVLRLDLDGKPAAGNPFGTAIWSFGHRNGQGLVFHPRTGVLYETEHGPGDNDEVNIIERGRNYGWPQVRGVCDTSYVREAKDFCRRHRVVSPISAWTPTVAIAGADLYLSDRIPGFQNSLLATSLNGGSLWRLILSPDGRSIQRRDRLLSGDYGRLRDVLVAPNGDIFLATSNRDGRGTARDSDDRILRLTTRVAPRR
jgi:glucose/arabinose dehydrogenase